MGLNPGCPQWWESAWKSTLYWSLPFSGWFPEIIPSINYLNNCLTVLGESKLRQELWESKASRSPVYIRTPRSPREKHDWDLNLKAEPTFLPLESLSKLDLIGCPPAACSGSQGTHPKVGDQWLLPWNVRSLRAGRKEWCLYLILNATIELSFTWALVNMTHTDEEWIWKSERALTLGKLLK